MRLKDTVSLETGSLDSVSRVDFLRTASGPVLYPTRVPYLYSTLAYDADSYYYYLLILYYTGKLLPTNSILNWNNWRTRVKSITEGSSVWCGNQYSITGATGPTVVARRRILSSETVHRELY